MTTYCWYEAADLEHVRGPFDTVQEALADASDSLSEGDDGEIVVAEVQNILPEDYVNVVDVDWLCERMDEALGEDVEVDDPVFDVPDSQMAEAEDALADALAEWAKKYVEVSNGLWTAGDVVQSVAVQVLAHTAGGKS